MAHCYTPPERLCPTHRNAGLGSPASTCTHLSDLIQDLESQTSRMGVTWALVGRSDWQTSNLFLPQKHSLWVNLRRKEAGRLPLPQNCKIETFQNHPSPGPPAPSPTGHLQSSVHPPHGYGGASSWGFLVLGFPGHLLSPQQAPSWQLGRQKVCCWCPPDEGFGPEGSCPSCGIKRTCEDAAGGCSLHCGGAVFVHPSPELAVPPKSCCPHRLHFQRSLRGRPCLSVLLLSY